MNKALLQNTYIMGGGFAKAIPLNELNVFFPELFEKMTAKTTQHLYGAVTWIYRATQIRANALQGLKHKVFRGEKEIFDSRTEGAVQPWFPETDLTRLFWRSQADRMLWGASYWEKIGNWMMPTNLRRLNPLTMRVIGDPKKGIKRFEQRIEGRKVATWLPREIVYQPLWRPDNDIHPGVAPAAVATMAGGLNENALRYAANFFEHGAIPPLLLTTDQNLPPQEIARVKTVWQRMHGSVRNAWRTAVLRGGLKPVKIGERTKDLAIPDLHAVVIAEIAAAYGMSVTFLEGKTANRATDEQETLKFVEGTIIPDAKLFQSGMNMQLWEMMGLRWEYLVNEIEAIQKNEAQKAEKLVPLAELLIEQVQAGLASRAQGIWGTAEIWSQMNMAFPKDLPGPLQEEALQPPPQVIVTTPKELLMLPAPPQPLEASAERMWQDVRRWRKVVKRLGPEKALKRGFESDVLTDETQQYVKMYLELADTTEEALEIFDHPFAKAVRETAEGNKDPDAAAKDRDEARIGLDMRRFFRGQLDRIIKKLGKKPDINKLDYAFWRKEREALGAVLQPHLNRMAEAGALTAYNTNPVTGGSGSKQTATMLAFDWTLVAEEAALWAEGHEAELITGVEGTTQRIVAKKVAAFVRTPGMTIGDLRSSLLPWFGQTRAQMIAVTETTAAYAEGQRVLIDRARRVGLKVEPIWRTAEDELVCVLCGPLANKPQKEWEAASPGTDWAPRHPRCILPGNVVIAPGGIQAATKSFYVGRGVEMSFADGRRLTITENHPILTGTGWIAAKLLNEGDYVLCATQPERIAAGIDPDIQQVPTMIEEIFATIKEASPMATISMPAAATDLHGEGHSIKGEIEIVRADSLLLGDGETMSAQGFGQDVFGGSNIGEGALSTQGLPALLIKVNDAPTASGVGRCHLCGSPLRRHASPFDGLSSGAASGGNVGGEQAASEGPAIDASLAREFVLRFASDVTAEQIVKIRDLNVACHVYDLQSDMYGLYITSGVITSNCRCWITQKWEVPTVERGPVEPAFVPLVSPRERIRQRALEVAENTIVGRDIETAVIIDERGEVLLSKTGTHNSVTFTDDEVALMRGATLTHNHPGGSSFSPGDVTMLHAHHQIETRAVGIAKDGITRLYRMRPDSTFYQIRRADIDEDIAAQNRGLKNEWSQRIIKGTLSMEDANRNHWHEVWTRLAAHYQGAFGIDLGYSREEM